ncbi:MAG: hypothetical protein JWM74_898 [Myxococcaceae bacterium]|nr:hypothetical protein [Myxococcaceae bacterium]
MSNASGLRPNPSLTQREELMSRVAVLGSDEVAVLVIIAERLVMGAKQYGALDIANDRRIWGREALDEQIDGSVYLAIEILKRMRGIR